MNSTVIADDSRITSDSVDFANDLPFGNAAHCGVTRHLSYNTHVHGNEQRVCAKVSGCRSGFVSSVSCADDDYVIFVMDHAS